MKTIPLTRGEVTMVDDADFEWLNQWKWFCLCAGGKKYAAREVQKNFVRTVFLMHRVIVGPADDLEVDHRDLNGLNNQRFNLRPATLCQNRSNTGARANNKCGFKGVYFDKDRRKYRAEITVNKKRCRLGSFATAREAASIWNVVATALLGPFARLNKL